MQLVKGLRVFFQRIRDSFSYEIGPDGRLPDLEKGRYKIVIDVLRPAAGWYPILVKFVDRDKNVLDPDKVMPSKTSRGAATYEKEVRVTGLNPLRLTIYPHNNVRAFVFTKSGKLRIEEVAFVKCGGKPYLNVQEVWNVQCYRSGAQVVCPRLGDWPQLQSLVQEVFQGLPDRLPWVGKYQRDPLPKPPTVRGTAGVLWYNVAMGYGLALTFDGKVARVDHNSFPHQDCLCLLREGDLLQYALIRSRMGRVAWELDGVRILEQAVA